MNRNESDTWQPHDVSGINPSLITGVITYEGPHLHPSLGPAVLGSQQALGGLCWRRL